MRRSRYKLFIAAVIACVIGLVPGVGLSQVLYSQAPASEPSPYGMVDPVAPELATSYEVYIEQCASCHVALPPAVLTDRAWQQLVVDPAHYGIALPPLSNIDQRLILNYLTPYAPQVPRGQPVAYRLSDSPHFQALHPAVTLPSPLNLRSCVSCHAGAPDQDFSEYRDPTAQLSPDNEIP